MSKILVTGGFGFVGGRISKKLSSKYEVVVSSRRQLDQEMLSLHGNVSQINHQKLFDKSSFPKDVQTIIHLAGLNELECVSNPSLAIRVNIDETRIILENAIENGVEQFIYFSTAHVYGSPLVGLITENSLPSPVHLYAITHKAAEDFIISAAMAKKLKGIVIRLSNSFGAPVIPSINRWTLLANDLARQAIENNVIRLHSNGCQHRDFVCLTDVENIIFEILDNNQPKFNDLIYNLGSGNSMRVVDFANRIVGEYKQLFEKPLPIKFPSNVKFEEAPDLIFCVDRLLHEDVIIKNDFDEEIRNLLLFCRDHFSRIQ